MRRPSNVSITRVCAKSHLQYARLSQCRLRLLQKILCLITCCLYLWLFLYFWFVLLDVGYVNEYTISIGIDTYVEMVRVAEAQFMRSECAHKCRRRYTFPEAFVLGFSTMKMDRLSSGRVCFGKYIFQLDPWYCGVSVIFTLIINNELQETPQVKWHQFNCANYNRDPTLYRAKHFVFLNYYW